jgi:hypothetical protein
MMPKIDRCKIINKMTNRVNIRYDVYIEDGGGGRFGEPVTIENVAAAIEEISLTKKALLERPVNADILEFWIHHNSMFKDNKGLSIWYDNSEFKVIDGPYYDRNFNPQFMKLVAERQVK